MLVDLVPASVKGAVTAFDDGVDRVFERLRGNPIADRLFYAASGLGEFSLIWHAMAWLPVLRSHRHVRFALETSLALATESVVVNAGIKSLFKRSRPVHDTPRPHHLRKPRTSSFPSGHASAAMVAASMLSRGHWSRKLFYLPALLVAFSRVHVRIHHASDVLGGLATGLALGRLFGRLRR